MSIYICYKEFIFALDELAFAFVKEGRKVEVHLKNKDFFTIHDAGEEIIAQMFEKMKEEDAKH